ncbi:hypothetical protein [Actinomycetospora chibensis]|uniref:Uncharacterized protein n=1 Tax=Actinomycetospora chibensis TaxID=663606 RepID=A0ABV9RCE5_9PSEU|nr:hypothetical protein [Actinomycetospora chibensis]MDD7927850.1 hypothetical protein [Actinomycetospora chibensis]
MADPSSGPGPSDDDPLEADEARRNPEDAVDALEQKVLGGPEHRLDGGYPDDLSPTEQNDVDHRDGVAPPGGGSEEPGPTTEPAFAVDVDPEDQGSPGVAPRNPD